MAREDWREQLPHRSTADILESLERMCFSKADKQGHYFLEVLRRHEFEIELLRAEHRGTYSEGVEHG